MVCCLGDWVSVFFEVISKGFRAFSVALLVFLGFSLVFFEGFSRICPAFALPFWLGAKGHNVRCSEVGFAFLVMCFLISDGVSGDNS